MTRPENVQPTSSALASEILPAARTTWLLPALLALIYLAQCAWFIRTQSLTYDEPVHIAEGLNAWRYGRFEQYNDHPPLARLWCALPLIDPQWQVDVEPLVDSFRVTRIAPDPVSLAWRARAMNVLFGLLLAWFVWRAADRLFSRTAANFALALFAFSPSLDRALFDRGNRWRRDIVYFCHGMGPGAVATESDLETNRQGSGCCSV